MITTTTDQRKAVPPWSALPGRHSGRWTPPRWDRPRHRTRSPCTGPPVRGPHLALFPFLQRDGAVRAGLLTLAAAPAHHLIYMGDNALHRQRFPWRAPPRPWRPPPWPGQCSLRWAWGNGPGRPRNIPSVANSTGLSLAWASMKNPSSLRDSLNIWARAALSRGTMAEARTTRSGLNSDIPAQDVIPDGYRNAPHPLFSTPGFCSRPYRIKMTPCFLASL